MVLYLAVYWLDITVLLTARRRRAVLAGGSVFFLTARPGAWRGSRFRRGLFFLTARRRRAVLNLAVVYFSFCRLPDADLRSAKFSALFVVSPLRRVL